MKTLTQEQIKEIRTELLTVIYDITGVISTLDSEDLDFTEDEIYDLQLNLKKLYDANDNIDTVFCARYCRKNEIFAPSDEELIEGNLFDNDN